MWKSEFKQNYYRTSFSPTIPPFAARISRVVADGGTWRLKWEGGGKQWQTTPKYLPMMQCARTIPVIWLGSGSCQARPSRLNINEWTKDSLSTVGSHESWWPLLLNHVPEAVLISRQACAYRILRTISPDLRNINSTTAINIWKYTSIQWLPQNSNTMHVGVTTQHTTSSFRVTWCIYLHFQGDILKKLRIL